MPPFVLLAIAVGLALDAFAVALAVGVSVERVTRGHTFRLAWHFGLFQFLMPIVGWLAGLTVQRSFAAFDHWIVFGLLSAIGGKMVVESLRSPKAEAPRADPTRGWSLVALSLATSIDALAVGLSLALLGTRIWYPAIVIGLTAGALTALGLQLGRPLGALFGRRIEALGGAVLIGIGVKTLFDHLGG
ncbi:MAG: manganese efflux pump [Proteobacteria bacterium]|nr:manganese efflux pump [Pseudomonadota bacterium]